VAEFSRPGQVVFRVENRRSRPPQSGTEVQVGFQRNMRRGWAEPPLRPWAGNWKCSGGAGAEPPPPGLGPVESTEGQVGFGLESGGQAGPGGGGGFCQQPGDWSGFSC
jgi:hypothetical protein